MFKMKNSFISVCMVLVFMPVICHGDSSLGMSEELKKASLDNLKAYQRNGDSLSVSQRKQFELEVEQRCDPDSQFRATNPQYLSSHCREEKYLNGRSFILEISFIRDEKFPVQPHAPRIKGSDPGKRDTIARDAHLQKWSVPVFEHYLGADYINFNKIELYMIRRKYVSIAVHVLDASELDELIKNPNIKSLRHVADPVIRLEEH